MNIKNAVGFFFIFLTLWGLWKYPEPLWHPEAQAHIETSTPKEIYTFQGSAMTMPYRISIESSFNPLRRGECEAAIQQIFNNTDNIFNRWNPHSELSRFNHFSSTHPVPIDPELRKLLLLAGMIHRQSAGLYDPTVLPLIQLWKKHLQKGTIPSEEELNKAKEAVGWEKLQFKTRHRLQKLDPHLQIDLGSIAKGYTVDALCEYFNKIGCKHVYVEWAGEVRVSGGHPLNRAWIVGIKNPFKDQAFHYISKIHINDGAIATSGHEQQYWLIRQEDGSIKPFSHIINPKTLQPLDISSRDIVSCTVVAPTCALADALATAGLMQPSLEEAKDWARRVIHEFEGTEVYIYCHDHRLWHFNKAKTQSQLILY